jgi:hypothetical protein
MHKHQSINQDLMDLKTNIRKTLLEVIQFKKNKS